MTIQMRKPKWQSSHISELGYDEETGTMAVTFAKGGTYHYPGVPVETYTALHQSGSPGDYFHRHVRGKFDHVRPKR